MIEELKPCPFCGRSEYVAKKKFHSPFLSAPEEYFLVCNQCESRGPHALRFSKAAELWNARPVEDALRAENEQLRAALEGLMKFHPDDELGETCEEYWSPEYSAAIQAVRAALEATK